MFALFALIACGVGELDVTSSAEGCTDYDFDDPEESALSSEVDGSTALVWRTYVERENTDDVFAPEIEGDAHILTVREKWQSGSDAKATCIEPRITITGLEGTLEVQWFTEDDETIPFNTIEVAPS